MSNRIAAILFLLIPSLQIVWSQNFTDSNLPIIMISTPGASEIPDDPKIPATMRIIWRGNGERNYVTDWTNPDYLNYYGWVAIELHGSSSQDMDKKSYGFSTRKDDQVTENNVSLLGMPADNDWLLISNVFDPSMIRNYLIYNLSRNIGQYASRTVFCEVMVNGEYKGLYLLLEKIKPGQNRVNIHKMGTDDNSYPDVTGGYITKSDKTTGGDLVAWYMSSYNWVNEIGFIHEKPDPETITTEQNYYIKSQFLKLSDLAHANDQSVETGFPSIIDVPSFIDYMILNELASNADAYTYSTFYHKDKNAKLRAGPLWDMDLTFGNDLFLWGYDRSKTWFWQFSNGENDGPKFWTDLFNNPKYKCYMSRRWNHLTESGQPLNYNTIVSLIDQVDNNISEALVREDQRWGLIGDHDAQISDMKSWLQDRIEWITNSVGPWSSCSDPDVPPLVITKIMYAPDTSVSYPVSKDLEFLEITNTGSGIEDLTGVYFSGTGFGFDFLPHSKIGPGESIILAGNAVTFRAKYGFLPFGQFTRNLSDSGENLLLVDGFGNTIDEVEYSNQLPWPDAEFNGKYLSLIDPSLNNNDGSNWTAESSTLVAVHDTDSDPQLIMFPSPVVNSLQIECGLMITAVEITNLTGLRIKYFQPNSFEYRIDFSSLPKGMYLIRIITSDRSFVRKIIKC
jgi:hypothetical protein